MKAKELTSTQISITINLVISKWRSVWGILRDNQSISRKSLTGIASEDVPLNEDLVVGARVDGLITEILVVVVV